MQMQLIAVFALTAIAGSSSASAQTRPAASTTPTRRVTTLPAKVATRPAPSLPRTTATIATTQPSLACIFPAGGQRGTTLPATISGANLLGCNQMTVSGEGVTARLLRVVNINTAEASFTIAPGAELGAREVRVANASGVSNRIRFIVGQLPELLEKEPNSDRSEAQKIDRFPVTINGQIQEGDRDCFRFAAKAGQTIVCEIQARAIIPFIADAVPGWNDAFLTLLDSSGRQVATQDDFRSRPDPVLIFRAPRDDEYTLQVNDVLFRGRGDFVYRLSIGELPFITHIFPLGGRRGGNADVQLHGANLLTDCFTLPIPADCAELRHLSVPHNQLRSNSVVVAAGDLPEVVEHEPNDTPGSAQRIQPPLVINGRINKPGDADYFIFSVKAGETLVMEVFARRLNSPVDSILTLSTKSGSRLAENDDTIDPACGLLTHHADSRIIHTFTAAGEYILRLRDVQGKGGDEYAYRLAIAPPQPDFLLRVSPDNPPLAQGGTTLLTINAIRRDGFTGEIALAVQNLPAGFIASEAGIRANQDQTMMTITAGAGAALGRLSPVVAGTAIIAGREVTRRAAPAETLMQAFSYTHVIPTDEFAMAVVDSAPFVLWTGRSPADVLGIFKGGEAEVPVFVKRKPGIRGAIYFKAGGPIGAVRVKSGSIPADKERGAVTLVASPTAVPGQQQTVIVIGTIRQSVKASLNEVMPAIPVKVLDPATTRPSPNRALQPKDNAARRISPTAAAKGMS